MFFLEVCQQKKGCAEKKGCSSYRYGFNGKEKDPEGLGGGGSTSDYGFRIYNPQIARFLSVDPLTASYPWYTPYQFAGNKPIAAIDLDGLEERFTFFSPIQTESVQKLLNATDTEVIMIRFFMEYAKNNQFVDDKGNTSDWFPEKLANSGFGTLSFDAAGAYDEVPMRSLTGQMTIDLYGTFVDKEGVISQEIIGSVTITNEMEDFIEKIEPTWIDNLVEDLYEWERNNGADLSPSENGGRESGGRGGKGGVTLIKNGFKSDKDVYWTPEWDDFNDGDTAWFDYLMKYSADPEQVKEHMTVIIHKNDSLYGIEKIDASTSGSSNAGKQIDEETIPNYK